MHLGTVVEGGVLLDDEEARWLAGLLASLNVQRFEHRGPSDDDHYRRMAQEGLGQALGRKSYVEVGANPPDPRRMGCDDATLKAHLIYSTMKCEPAPLWARRSSVPGSSVLEMEEGHLSLFVPDHLFQWDRFE